MELEGSGIAGEDRDAHKRVNANPGQWIGVIKGAGPSQAASPAGTFEKTSIFLLPIFPSRRK
jgi:hypothetical protein